MAEKRMFSKQIIDSDAFLDMPLSTQALYFHLSMRADDQGFLNNANRIRKNIGASEDDLKLLLIKKFVISFETGVIVIKHWQINNYIQKDRFKPTVYQEELSQLTTKNNKTYTLKTEQLTIEEMQCIQSVSKMDTQISIDKYLEKSSTKDNKRGMGEEEEEGKNNSLDSSTQEYKDKAKKEALEAMKKIAAIDWTSKK